MAARPDQRYKISDEELVIRIKDLDTQFFSATELAEHVPITRQAVSNRLDQLESQNVVDRKKRGNQTIGWWLNE